MSVLVPPGDMSSSPIVSVPAPREIGGPGRRTLAFLLDALIVGGAAMLLAIPFFGAFSRLGAWGRLVGFCVSLPYFAILDSSIGHGQTIGKRVLGLQVVDVYGQTISLGRALVRYALFAVPYFLNGIALPITRTPWTFSHLVAPLFEALGFANFYLMLCNRHTRQGIHDLAVGSFVAEADKIGSVRARPIWKMHWAILGSLLVIFTLAGGILTKKLLNWGPMPQLFQDITLIEKMDGVQQAGAQAQTNWTGSDAKRKTLELTIRWTGKSKDQEAFADRVAKVILENDQHIQDYDQMLIQVIEGYDLGIAHFSLSHSFEHTPEEWRARAIRVATPGCAGANCI